jgi:serine/threonine protein kinase
MEAILDRACAKNPALRYKDAEEFFQALQRIESMTDSPSVLTDSKPSISKKKGKAGQRRESGEGTAYSPFWKPVGIVGCVFGVLFVAVLAMWALGFLRITI